jgi:hypothetical protein
MTKQQILDELLALHDPKLANVECSHVSMIWEDGEHMSTKCGSLFGQRNHHMLAGGYARPELAAFLLPHMPMMRGKGADGREHGCVFVPYEHADRLNKQINSWTPADE